MLDRVNLNVPSDLRRRLRALSQLRGTTESETARDLLADAIERAEREAFYKSVAEAQTPALRARQLEVLTALEEALG